VCPHSKKERNISGNDVKLACRFDKVKVKRIGGDLVLVITRANERGEEGLEGEKRKRERRPKGP